MLVHTVHLTGDESCQRESNHETGDYPAGKKHGAFFENHLKNRRPSCSKRETDADLAISLLNSIRDDCVQSSRSEKNGRCGKGGYQQQTETSRSKGGCDAFA